jgi:hypothetical protein
MKTITTLIDRVLITTLNALAGLEQGLATTLLLSGVYGLLIQSSN